MTSRLPDAKAAVTALIESLTPPSVATPGYSYADTAAKLSGTPHRVFFHAPANAQITLEYGEDSAVLEYRWALQLWLSPLRYTLDTLFDACAHEALAIFVAIATQASWPAGIQHLRCDGYSIDVDEETQQVSVIFDLFAAVQEDL